MNKHRVKTSGFLIVNDAGGLSIRKNKPSLAFNEIAIEIKLDLPSGLFDRPKLQASITIPENAALPELINGVVVDNVQEAVHTATGLNFDITIIKNKEDGQEG